jgi:hypothetical protein
MLRDSAYAIASSRLRMSHSRHGAMTGSSGAKGEVGELEPDLIVPLAGAAVGQRVGADAVGDFHLAARDQRAPIAVPSRYFRL